MELINSYALIFRDAFWAYANYFIHELITPRPHNYFYGLVVLSLFALGLEWSVPWRKKQKRWRKDFWLDAFYMFFNFFLFSLLGYHAIAAVVEHIFTDLRQAIGLSGEPLIYLHGWSHLTQLIIMLVARDFIHYWIHRLLHLVPALWAFHKVHHSVLEMGFAAHLRYHWMETIVYRSLEYIPLGLLGFSVQDFFIVHIFTLAIGHLNHANIRLPLGPLRYVFNSPQMHLWHHARELPRVYGANFGLTLSVWDWLFGTVYWPKDSAELPLGFENVEVFPQDFWGQTWRPWLESLRFRS